MSKKHSRKGETYYTARPVGDNGVQDIILQGREREVAASFEANRQKAEDRGNAFADLAIVKTFLKMLRPR